MGEQERAISRREALKLSAKVAGTAAFATPVVVGAFSAPAVGQTVPLCTPENDSDAVIIDSAGGTKWNINCTNITPEVPYGRYNSQRSEFGETEIGSVSIVFGWGAHTDNFPTHKSWYTIDEPAGWTCSAEWAISLGGPNTTGEGCDPIRVKTSTPPPQGAGPSLSTSAADAQPLPYCEFTPGTSDDKCNNQFLELVELVCCQVVDL